MEARSRFPYCALIPTIRGNGILAGFLPGSYPAHVFPISRGQLPHRTAVRIPGFGTPVVLTGHDGVSSAGPARELYGACAPIAVTLPVVRIARPCPGTVVVQHA